MRVAQLLAIGASLRAAAAIPVTADEVNQKSAQGLHLVKLSAEEEPTWMTFDEEMELVQSNTNFVRCLLFCTTLELSLISIYLLDGRHAHLGTYEEARLSEDEDL